MMVFTHILLGVVIGSGVAVLLAVDPLPIVVAGAIGGVVPDLDMVLVHRKSAHFPVVYSALVPVGAAGYWLVNHQGLLLLGVGLAAAGLHSLMDMLGGGKEMRPWRRTDDRAVYNHVTGRWIKPLRVFYDGSVPDLLLAAGSGVVAIWLLPATYTLAIGALIGGALGYALVRRAVTRWIPEQYATFSSYIQAKLQLDNELSNKGNN